MQRAGGGRAAERPGPRKNPMGVPDAGLALGGKAEYAEVFDADLSQVPVHVVENVIDCGLTQQFVDDLREMSF